MIEGMEHSERCAVPAADILKGAWWSRGVCEELAFFVVFNSLPHTRPPTLSLLHSPHLVPKPSTIHQRTPRPPLCNNSAVSGGNVPSQCMRQHLFFNQLSETNNPHWQKMWYTNRKRNHSHHLSGRRKKTEEKKHLSHYIMPTLILFPSITFNYSTAPLRMTYFITTERPIVPKAVYYISRLCGEQTTFI